MNKKGAHRCWSFTFSISTTIEHEAVNREDILYITIGLFNLLFFVCMSNEIGGRR